MILTSWKEIASRLNCTVRTAQRWERHGLPVSRPVPGRRGHVTADPEMLESWLRGSAFWRRKDFAFLNEVQRARTLRADARLSRERLQTNMALLKRQANSMRRSIEHLQATPHKPN
jgi:phage terminase Nu1 subunit (DNA packaging protein)